MRKCLLSLGMFFFIGLSVAGQGAPATLEVTYLANEGFLLRRSEQVVIIDGLFRRRLDPYAVLPPEERKKIETAQPPYEAVDLVLVTHFHADHFDAHAVGRHLLNNPEAVLLSSTQVVSRLEVEFDQFEAIQERVQPVLPFGGPVRKEVAGIEVEVRRITHGERSPPVVNLGYLIRLGNTRILHIGDSEASKEDLEGFGWAAEQIDIAFLPYWYLIYDPWKPYVKPLIGARRIVAMHIPPDEVDEVKEKIRTDFPNAVVFSRPLEKKTF